MHRRAHCAEVDRGNAEALPSTVAAAVGRVAGEGGSACCRGTSTSRPARPGHVSAYAARSAVSVPAVGALTAEVRRNCDLVVDPPTGVVIELKYPRDSRSGISPDPMTFGDLLRDFLQVAVVPAGDRWVVQVLNHRLTHYVKNAFGRYGLGWAGPACRARC